MILSIFSFERISPTHTCNTSSLLKIGKIYRFMNIFDKRLSSLDFLGTQLIILFYGKHWPFTTFSANVNKRVCLCASFSQDTAQWNRKDPPTQGFPEPCPRTEHQHWRSGGDILPPTGTGTAAGQGRGPGGTQPPAAVPAQPTPGAVAAGTTWSWVQARGAVGLRHLSAPISGLWYFHVQ